MEEAARVERGAVLCRFADSGRILVQGCSQPEPSPPTFHRSDSVISDLPSIPHPQAF